MLKTTQKPANRILVFAAAIFVFASGAVFASEELSDLTISSHGNSSVIMFPEHKVEQFGFSMESPEVARVDFYNWAFSVGTKIIPAPHPLIKFMRISQVSYNPNVVRASLVFAEPVKAVPSRLGTSLMLKITKQKTRNTNKQTVSSAKAAEQSSETVLDTRVSLNFDQEDLITILNALALKFNLRIFADSGVKGKYTVHADDVALRDVLKNLLLQRSFQYTLKGRDLTVISLGTDSSRMARELLFRDLSLKDALQTLSKMMNVNLIIHESVEDKKVNFYVENLNLDELLDVLIQTNGLIKRPYNDNTFIIINKENANEFGKKQYRTFKLINATPEEVVKMISSNKSLSEKIKVENLSLNERINTVSAYDSKENLALIKQVIESCDEKVKQAVIEVKLVEISRKSAKELGIQLDNYNVNVADIGRLPSSYALPATLRFLEEKEGAKVLASPKIRVIHNKPARIFIGRTLPIPYYDYAYASSTNALYPTSGETLKKYKDVDVGIELNVTPQISSDNEISLDLQTDIKDIEGEPNVDGQYVFATKTTKTFVRIKDGETVIMGGLISRNNKSRSSSPALLNKIPVLRSILTGSNNTNEEREMIMLVTPRLVNLPEAEESTNYASY